MEERSVRVVVSAIILCIIVFACVVIFLIVKKVSSNKKVETKVEKRLERITLRDKIDKELAEKRFASQLSAEFFCKNCDYVIYNNGKLEDTINKTLNVIRTIKEGINGKEEETQKEKNTE